MRGYARYAEYVKEPPLKGMRGMLGIRGTQNNTLQRIGKAVQLFPFVPDSNTSINLYLLEIYS